MSASHRKLFHHIPHGGRDESPQKQDLLADGRESAISTSLGFGTVATKRDSKFRRCARPRRR